MDGFSINSLSQETLNPRALFSFLAVIPLTKSYVLSTYCVLIIMLNVGGGGIVNKTKFHLLTFIF